MITQVLPPNNAGVHWLDVVNPTQEELQRIAAEYGFHSKMVEDCLEPEHLPKFEPADEKTFLITRAVDPEGPRHADTVQQLTRKIAIFAGKAFLITIHRVPIPVLEKLKEYHTRSARGALLSSNELLVECLNAIIATYEEPLDRLEEAIDRFEKTIFANRDVITQLKAIHRVKRQVAVHRRLLWHTYSAIQKLHPHHRGDASVFQDLKENTEATYLYADELLEDLNALLQLHISMASHRTNEVVRLLTVFSVFFLPLTFIVGIYGMNFRNMPELEWKYGYFAALTFMIAVAGGIFLWFRRRGYLR